MKIRKNNNLQKKSFSKLVFDLAYKIRTMSFARHILIFYLLITIIGALLLYAPFSQTGFVKWDPIKNELIKGKIDFIDSLFTAASAFSDTGLVTHTTAITYNEFGQTIIAILIFTGGIGLFALKVFIFNIIFKLPISFRTQESLTSERGSVKIGITKDLIKIAIITLLIITIIFSVILTIIFYYTDVSNDKIEINNTLYKNSKFIYTNPYYNANVALKFGVFHTISALNNAGFDIIGNNSLMPYYGVPSIQILFIILFVIGGMGYGVIYDLYNFFKTKKNHAKFRFSLFTKLSTLTYFCIAIFGVSVAFAIETTSIESFWKNNSIQYKSKSYKSLAIFFNTMSTRNAGFSTIDMNEMSKGTLMLYVALMFIGSAPSSTAGGIRTTTLAILFLGLWSMIKGRKNIYAFRRIIKKETVNRAFVVFTSSILICFVGSLISMTSLNVFNSNNKTEIIDDSHRYIDVIFEVASAFGTTGLSTGLTTQLSLISKLTLILIMFIGQLGISSTFLVWGSSLKTTDNHYGRVIEDISIG